MADAIDDFIGKFLPNLTPDEKAQFRSQNAPQPSAISQWVQAQKPSSYEGVRLQDLGPKPDAGEPFGPPAPPRKSYEGASLQSMTNPEVQAPKSFPIAAASNVTPPDVIVPTSPKALAQATRVANASDRTSANVARALANDAERGGSGEGFFREPENAPVAGGGIARMPGTLISPGGRTAHSWTVQEGLELPATAAALGRADASGREAAAAERDVGVQQANAEVGYLDQFQKAQEERALRLKWQAEDRARRIDAEMDKLGEMTDAVRADKIDPGAFFTAHGTAGGFMAAIAYALGAVGGALTHTENPVIGVIRNEIQTQKDNIALRRDSVAGQRSLLGQLAKTFGDDDIAENAAWAAYLEKAKTQMTRIVADSKNAAVQAKYKSAIAGIDAELVPRIQAIESMIQDRVARQDVNAPPQYAGAGGPSKIAREDARYIAEANEKAGIPTALSELKDIDRSIDALGSGDIPGVGPIVSHIPGMLLSDRAVAGRQALQTIKNQIAHAISGSAISPREAENLERQLDGANDANSIRRTVQSFRQSLQMRAANIAAGSSTEGVDLYEQRGGSVQRGAPSDRQVSPTKPTVPYVRPPE